MSDKSKIEWTDATWNPIRAGHPESPELWPMGWHCEHVSEACRNCYAEAMNKRLGTGLEYKPGNRGAVGHYLNDKTLIAPLHWKRPRRIFVCSTTDLFGDWVKDEWLDRMFAVMALAPQHTFQVLTKRPARMREYFAGFEGRGGLIEAIAGFYVDEPARAGKWPFDKDRAIAVGLAGWPLPNVWLGVTAEDQKTANERILELLASPAAVRFVSIEPVLGPVNLLALTCSGDGEMDALNPRLWVEEIEQWRGSSETWEEDFLEWYGFSTLPSGQIHPVLDLVIAGGESGQHARPSHPDWFRSLRDQCAAAAAPFFMKQWGEWLHNDQLGWWPYGDEAIERCRSEGNFFRVGKRAAGRLLDGVEHSEFPRTAP